MEVKMLKVSTPDGKLTRLVEASQRQEYLDKGWIIEDTSEVEMMLDEDGNTMWRYKEDTEWNTISGTGGGVTVYADLAAIKAVDTTSTTTYTDGVMVRVLTLGTFEFSRTSTAVGDDVNVIVPTTGGGKWLLVEGIRVIAPTSTNAEAWREMHRTRYLFGGRAVKTLPATTMGKKIVCLGSSVMLGFGLATPTTQSYPALTLAEMSGWTLKNMSISGNTSAQVVARFHTEVMPENPDIIWIGISPNNEGLDNATTDALAFSAIYNFEKGVETIVRLCEQNQIPYIISGLYPKGTYTPLTYKYLKRFNIALQKKYGTRYINWLGTLDDGTGKFKSTLVQADTVHPNADGALNMFKCIPKALFEFLKPMNRSGGYKKANGIILGSDTTTAQPLAMYNSGVVRNNSFTIRTEFKGNVATDNVLIYVNGTSGTKLITVVKNSSGNFEVRNNGVSIMTTTTAVPSIGYNIITLTFDKVLNIFYLWLNGIQIGSSTTTTFFFAYFAIGGGDTPANNAVGVEFRNVGYWINNFTSDEVVADANGELLEGSLCLFNSLTTQPNGYFDNDGGAETQCRFKINSTLWTLSTETDNLYTDVEKTKLANSVSGTFTTTDGKTITITGGMVTSIA
jgi:lysophospholipase L1-like esterase